MRSKGVAVTLAYPEVTLAAQVGVARHVAALEDGRRNRYDPQDGAPWWERDIQGALGEYVFAKYLGAFWDPQVRVVGRRDVAGFEVRTAALTGASACLPIHMPDPDGIYVLVTGIAPHFVVRGWIHSRDGRRQEWWRDRNDGRFMYYVPLSALEDIADLPRTELAHAV